ncbi:MAG: hypothetical protein NWE82_03910 [Candidatus Bathyarchaeota archaeon]|nr:hypothetical protein [Candidatus Bathyarchaeota archaeon]
MKLKLSAQSVALMALFASLYYVLSIFTPYVPAVGVPTVRISLEALMASVFGLVLGPYLGASTAFIGAFGAWILPPGSGSPFGLPFLLSPPINALVVGLIYYKKWKAAFVAFAVLIVVFLFLPPSQPLSENLNVGVAVVWDKLIALFLIIPAVFVANRKLSRRQAAGFSGVFFMVIAALTVYLIPQLDALGSLIILVSAVLISGVVFLSTVFITFGAAFSEKAVTAGLLYFLLAFIGNQADNMWGANAFAFPIVYEGIFSLPVETVRFLFVVSPLLYPTIRVVQAIIATIIAIPLMKALKSSSWFKTEKTIESSLPRDAPAEVSTLSSS